LKEQKTATVAMGAVDVLLKADPTDAYRAAAPTEKSMKTILIPMERYDVRLAGAAISQAM
jgi:hypothetical protein